MRILNKKLLILSLFSILFIMFWTLPTYAENVTLNNDTVNGWDKTKNYYYINSVVQKGFKKIDGKNYYFDKNSGKKVTGLKKIKKSYYYFNSKGVMQVGWKEIKNNKYYFLKTKKNYGKAVTGKVKIGKKYYKFKSNGKLIKKIDEMTYKVDKYKSPTKYLILVDKKTHKVGVYKGKKGKWKRIKNYSCTIGARKTPTPSGTFYIGGGRKIAHVTYFDSGKIRCWYATRIKGEYYFHSVLYTQYRKPTRVANGRLGANLSHGCIRLQLNNAKWIYNNIPVNTKCIIY